MQWICEQEGIQADPEALAVLAHAGEGSVRDSLSALDQAIACCGSELKPAEVRELLGVFSLEALEQVSDALLVSGAGRMLEVVAELEAKGANLQHFCRELARYFRNLLVSKIAGSGTRLIAAGAREKDRIGEVAGKFSEEDLTRYLQLSLDLFRDLQFSLQPRLHLELGLLRMVHAGRLVSIEEALAGLGGASGPQSTPPPPAKAAASPQPASATGTRERLHHALMQLGMAFTADAIAHSTVEESAAELLITTPEEFRLSLREADLKRALETIGAGARRIRLQYSATGEGAALLPVKDSAADEDLRRRALENPEVRRFQNVFPESQLRQVRDLKE
jgi:DNA polymerase-3 subunit gamma/tau